VKFHGRNIDALAFWDRYVELAPDWPREAVGFTNLVHCPNPQHDNTRSPAFQINLDKPLVHCFSQCGISGTYEHAVCVVEGLYLKFKVEEASTKQERARRKTRALREAKKIILRGSSGISRRPHQRKPVKKVRVERAKLEYEHFLPPVAQEYLQSRGISAGSISRWSLGWDPDDKRIVIPAFDEHNHLKFLIKRAVTNSQHPKYLYSEDSKKTEILFGATSILPRQGIVLTEGSLDVIRLAQHGFDAVGVLGTGISDEQVTILSRLQPRKIYLMFDKDTAGIRNIEVAMLKLRKYPLFVCRYPKGKSDAAELTKAQAMKSVNSALPALLWRSKVRKMQGSGQKISLAKESQGW